MTNHALDRISGLVLCGLGLFVVFGAWSMPRFEAQGASIYQAPGLTPALLGAALALCGALLAFRKARADGKSHSYWDAIAGTPQNRKRALAALALTLSYGAVLFGNVPFLLATFLFVFGFVITFEHWLRPEERAPRHIGKTIGIASLLGISTAFLCQYLFQTLFLVQLP
ncbi:tripartite tricarboxylate transporter TctB family protein [Cognatishimia maritima]|uniref:Tripartite tricarboxylate transporter TctB family protein n=1 Tax=Cognatishimia maritima TaxID=870908 RepID=A0A1M5QWH7_9RHOB|nr:tripartite tricarboxylate transporter TctB family protein [Cognatishimia maritima]SHH18100.1 Tripartite tricarboxylate transporter TctB family protein [Cognatishimia maritima]